MELSGVIAHMDCHSILGAGMLLNVLSLAIYTMNESVMTDWVADDALPKHKNVNKTYVLNQHTNVMQYVWNYISIPIIVHVLWTHWFEGIWISILSSSALANLWYGGIWKISDDEFGFSIERIFVDCSCSETRLCGVFYKLMRLKSKSHNLFPLLVQKIASFVQNRL